MKKTWIAGSAVLLSLAAGAAVELGAPFSNLGAEVGKRDVVLFVPAHPDDMIVALGFCHLAKNVYDLHVVDFTHGERGCGEEKRGDSQEYGMSALLEEVLPFFLFRSY